MTSVENHYDEVSLPQFDLVEFVAFHNTLGKYVFPHGIFLFFPLMPIFIVDCFALHLDPLFFFLPFFFQINNIAFLKLYFQIQN